jgi:hypothetical protein
MVKLSDLFDELCRDLSFFEVVLKGDSLTVTNAIGGHGENWLKFGQIMEDIKLFPRSSGSEEFFMYDEGQMKRHINWLKKRLRDIWTTFG